jgi:3-phenylpropionate/trans-cinnamate dioxygenase ferredoxin reductase subunit
MTASGPMVIIGAGLAGDAAAGALREGGYTGQIVLIGDEAHRPYDRPPLSKAALQSPDARVFLRDEAWYAENGVLLTLGDRAEAIDRAGKTVRLSSGSSIAYDKLLLATGTRVRTLAELESAPAPVRYLRTLDDAATLRGDMGPGRRIVFIGAGVIGLEAAASAASLGCKVTVIEGLDRAMARCLTPSLSAFMHQVHQARGVELILDAKLVGVSAVDGAAAVELADGRRIMADAIVAGVGVTPNCELAVEAGLEVQDGIVVDAHARTSDPDIFAAGDVARFPCREGGLGRVEQWRHAIDHGVAAAKAMLGEPVDYREEAWFWSDQFDLNIQVTGRPAASQEVVRGEMGESGFIVFHLEGGRLVGATSVNQPRFRKPIGELVAAQAVIDPAVLADPDSDLKALAKALAAERA